MHHKGFLDFWSKPLLRQLDTNNISCLEIATTIYFTVKEIFLLVVVDYKYPLSDFIKIWIPSLYGNDQKNVTQKLDLAQFCTRLFTL